MIVGEAYGENEERTGIPFSGASGQELNRMLHEAGIMRSECYVTNVVNARPKNNDLGEWIAEKKKDITPKHTLHQGKWVLPIVLEGIERLRKEISLVRPNVIVAAGNLPMWALLGKWGILKMRGSTLLTPEGIKLIPVVHPAAILRQWELRATAVLDLRRAARERLSRELKVPSWNFIINPTFSEACDVLSNLLSRADTAPYWLDFDLETKAGHISCTGLSWSLVDAICIPWMRRGDRDGRWSEVEESHLVYRLYQLLTHQNVWVRGQNLLYDCQYTYRHWHFVPNVKQDTMISHHTCFAGLKKSLDFQASMYCEYYVQWKPDKISWKEGG